MVLWPLNGGAAASFQTSRSVGPTRSAAWDLWLKPHRAERLSASLLTVRRFKAFAIIWTIHFQTARKETVLEFAIRNWRTLFTATQPSLRSN